MNILNTNFRFNKTEEVVIEELELEMRTYRKQYNSTLQCDDIEYYPLSMQNNKFPLSPKNFTYTAKIGDTTAFPKCESKKHEEVSVFQQEIIEKNAKETLKYKINQAQNGLMAFGVWGRLFHKDVDHNKGITDEDVEHFNTILDRIYAGSSD